MKVDLHNGSRMRPYKASATSKSNVYPLDLWLFFVQKCFWISLCTLSSVATVNADHSTFPILINDVDCSRPFGLVFLLFAIDWCHMPAVSVDSGTAPNQGHWEKRASNLCYGSISLSSQPQAGPHRAKAQKHKNWCY